MVDYKVFSYMRFKQRSKTLKIFFRLEPQLVPEFADSEYLEITMKTNSKFWDFHYF